MVIASDLSELDAGVEDRGPGLEDKGPGLEDCGPGFAALGPRFIMSILEPYGLPCLR